MPFAVFGRNRSIVAQVTETNPKRSLAMITAIDGQNRPATGFRTQPPAATAAHGPR